MTGLHIPGQQTHSMISEGSFGCELPGLTLACEDKTSKETPAALRDGLPNPVAEARVWAGGHRGVARPWDFFHVCLFKL